MGFPSHGMARGAHALDADAGAAEVKLWFDFWWKCDACGEFVAPYQDHEHHELLQVTVAQDRSVTRENSGAIPFISRCNRFLRRRFLRDVIADHRVETR